MAAAADEGWVTFLCVLSLSSERTSRVRVILSFSSKPSRAKRFASERQMLHLDTHQPPASGMHGRGFAARSHGIFFPVRDGGAHKQRKRRNELVDPSRSIKQKA